MKGPDCLSCRHYAPTADPAMPYSCSFYGLYSRSRPSAQIRLALGYDCPHYVMRAQKKADKDQEPRDHGPGWIG